MTKTLFILLIKISLLVFGCLYKVVSTLFHKTAALSVDNFCSFEFRNVFEETAGKLQAKNY